MYVKKKIKGTVLLELVAAMAIVSVLLIPQMKEVMSVLKQLHNGLLDQQVMVERLDLHQSMTRDFHVPIVHQGDCCFTSEHHEVCYDIKNNQMRRRKKKHASTRYYTHFIGMKKAFKSLTCQKKETHVTVNIEYLEGAQHDWIFRL